MISELNKTLKTLSNLHAFATETLTKLTDILLYTICCNFLKLLHIIEFFFFEQKNQQFEYISF